MNRRSLLAMLFGAAAVAPAAATVVVRKKTEAWRKLPNMYVMGEHGPEILGPTIYSKPLPPGWVEVEPVDGYAHYERITDVIIREVKRAAADGRFDKIVGPGGGGTGI